MMRCFVSTWVIKVRTSCGRSLIFVITWPSSSLLMVLKSVVQSPRFPWDDCRRVCHEVCSVALAPCQQRGFDNQTRSLAGPNSDAADVPEDRAQAVLFSGIAE